MECFVFKLFPAAAVFTIDELDVSELTNRSLFVVSIRAGLNKQISV